MGACISKTREQRVGELAEEVEKMEGSIEAARESLIANEQARRNDSLFVNYGANARSKRLTNYLVWETVKLKRRAAMLERMQKAKFQAEDVKWAATFLTSLNLDEIREDVDFQRKMTEIIDQKGEELNDALMEQQEAHENFHDFMEANGFDETTVEVGGGRRGLADEQRREVLTQLHLDMVPKPPLKPVTKTVKEDDRLAALQL